MGPTGRKWLSRRWRSEEGGTFALHLGVINHGEVARLALRSTLCIGDGLAEVALPTHRRPSLRDPAPSRRPYG